ncbi:MAG TPA: hypothetical protein VFZ32_05500 [Micromonosporaceae bacterium]
MAAKPLCVVLLAAVIGIVLIGPYPGRADPGDTPEPSPSDTMSATVKDPVPSQTAATTPTTTPTESHSTSPSSEPSPEPSPEPTPGVSTVSRPPEPSGKSREQAPVGRYQGSRVVPRVTPTGTPEVAAAPPRSVAPDKGRQEIPADPRYVSEAVSRGLIFGGATGFVVSVIGMMLVGWLRRRV